MIKTETIENVRERTDIVELVGSYLPLKKVGRNYRGLCPFHQERTPSFYVSPERQTYHCFGCGTGGNAISFVMAHEKLEFPEAVRVLARRLGITVLEGKGAGRNRGLYEACEQAARFFERQLAKSEPARRYLEKRELGPDTVKRYRLGFVPGGNRLRGEARKRSWSEDEMVRAGLLVKRDSGLADYFFDRLMFPVFSRSGKIVGFGARVLGDREPKYLNSPDGPIFRKGENLYGGFQAKGYIREQPPILVEGNFDLLSLADRGIVNVVAPLGTALTPDQAAMLRRYNRRVIVCFDGDEAGRKATRRVLDVLLQRGCEPQVAVMPDGVDPDDYIRRHGVDRFREVLSRPQDIVEFVLAGKEFRGVPDERAAVREVVGLLRLIADDTTRELYANRLAVKFKVDKAAVLRAASSREGEIRRRPRRAEPGVGSSLEEKLLAAAVQDASLAKIARDFRIADALTSDRLRAVAELVTEHCDEPGFGPARILDLIEEENTRRLVAGWTFTERAVLKPAEFEMWAKRLRAAWLHRRIVAAHEDGKSSEVEMLSKEQGELLKEATRERSNRQ